MKKILFFLTLPALILTFMALATPALPRLYLLNWGEYIDDDLIKKFEEEFNCDIYEETVSSSESMYQKIYDGKTHYDVAIPGDYVIEKLYKKSLINELDFNRIPNYYSGMFVDDLESLRKNSTFPDFYKYSMPYFWGAYAIIYRTDEEVSYVKDVVEEYGFSALFDRSLYKEHADDVKIGMYDIARYGVTAYLLINGYDINTTDYEVLEGAISYLKNARYNRWGTDELKKDVASGNLDVFLAQLGDFFDQRYVVLDSFKDVNFNCYIPQKTAAFFDAMVIPKTAQNEDLAYKFINFMLDHDNAYQNASFVGYSPTIKTVVEEFKLSINDVPNIDEFDSTFEYEEALYWYRAQVDLLSNHPEFLNPLEGREATLFADLGNQYAAELSYIKNKAKE